MRLSLSHERGRVTVGVLGFGALLSLFYVAEQMARRGVEPYWLAMVLIGLVVLTVAVNRTPAIFIPPVIFIGTLKTTASSTLQPSDPTTWALFLLVGTITFQTLRRINTNGIQAVKQQLAGQQWACTWYLLFIGVIALSYLHTASPVYGAWELKKVAFIGSLCFLSPMFLINSASDLWHFIISTLVLALLLIVRRFAYLTSSFSSARNDDATSIGTGALLGMTLLMIMFYGPTKNKFARIMIIGCIPVLAAGLLASLSRGALISFILMTVVGYILPKRGSGVMASRRAGLVLVTLLLMGFVVSLYWVEAIAPKRVMSKVEELTVLSEGNDPGGSAGKRLTHYRAALAAFTEKPIMGWGIGGSSMYQSGMDKRLHPHNLVLEVASEEGIIGLLSLCFFLCSVFAALTRAYRISHGELAFLSLIIGFELSLSMVSGNLDDQRPLLLWSGMAFIACLGRLSKDDPRPSLQYGLVVDGRTVRVQNGARAKLTVIGQ